MRNSIRFTTGYEDNRSHMKTMINGTSTVMKPTAPSIPSNPNDGFDDRYESQLKINFQRKLQFLKRRDSNLRKAYIENPLEMLSHNGPSETRINTGMKVCVGSNKSGIRI